MTSKLLEIAAGIVFGFVDLLLSPIGLIGLLALAVCVVFRI